MSTQRMPTGAKLVSAFGFCALCYLAALIFKVHFKGQIAAGALPETSAIIGLIGGWRIIGSEVRKGWMSSMNSGVKTAVLCYLMALFLFSTEAMMEMALRRVYHGPMEALLGIFSKGIAYFQQSVESDLFIVLLGGGAILGLVSEWAARRWP